MGWKADAGAAFSGGSGQMAVIGELLHRRCNAAVPHIDVGTDVFAFHDDRPEVARIQVKTAPGTAYRKGEGYSARFGVPMKQLRRADDPPLFYALVVRLNDRWGSFIIISRGTLKELWNNGCGSENASSGDLELYIQFRPVADQPEQWSAVCGTFDLTDHLNAWNVLPPLKPLAPISGGEGANPEPLPA
jgi:hypothetical protein